MRTLLASAAILVGLARPAGAVPIVLETYPGARPKDAERVMPVLLSDFASLGYVALADDVRAALGPQAPLPGRDADETDGKLALVFRAATNAWIEQPADDLLVPPLAAAVAAAERNPALLVGNRLRRTTFKDILVDLALAYQRDGQLDRSRDTLAELIRSFPTDVVTQQERGPEAEQYYKRTRAELDHLGRGTLTVTVSDPNVSIYVDEVIRPAGTPLPDLLPGVYRVVAIDPSGQARRYAVRVLRDQDSALAVDWTTHAALTIDAASVAFIFQTAAGYARRVEVARRYVRAATASEGVVLLEVGRDKAAVAVTAALYGVGSGRTLRKARVVLTGRGDEAHLLALAAFIVHGRPSADVAVLETFVPPSP